MHGMLELVMRIVMLEWVMFGGESCRAVGVGNVWGESCRAVGVGNAWGESCRAVGVGFTDEGSVYIGAIGMDEGMTPHLALLDVQEIFFRSGIEITVVQGQDFTWKLRLEEKGRKSNNQTEAQTEEINACQIYYRFNSKIQSILNDFRITRDLTRKLYRL
ncbi:hypothetical protein HNY73_012504 [Argiope bruennichi]|uniref:Uncharacterized protein n=1 Tax=Argiope bruennichi TaxID=94029 RepID=A0A8T0F0U2_ARGBR|nr:hypothetical protein HNY73_012504 [Argiope bruennichi]